MCKGCGRHWGVGRRGEEWLAAFEGAMAALWEVLVEVSVQWVCKGCARGVRGIGGWVGEGRSG